VTNRTYATWTFTGPKGETINVDAKNLHQAKRFLLYQIHDRNQDWRVKNIKGWTLTAGPVDYLGLPEPQCMSRKERDAFWEARKVIDYHEVNCVRCGKRRLIYGAVDEKWMRSWDMACDECRAELMAAHDAQEKVLKAAKAHEDVSA